MLLSKSGLLPSIAPLTGAFLALWRWFGRTMGLVGLEPEGAWPERMIKEEKPYGSTILPGAECQCLTASARLLLRS